MSARAQRVCLLSGIGLIGLFLLGFAIAGFIVPTDPTNSADQVAAKFADDRNAIRIGMLLAMFGAALLIPWSGALLVQLRRAEGRFSPFPWVQFGCATIFSLEFIYLLLFWQTAAFRADRAPELILMLNEMAWLPFVGVTSTAVVMSLTMGLSMLGDRRTSPVFPRWAGYFNIWAALLFTPGSICPFFHTGPFAFNGIFAWYLPLSVFTIWVPLNTYLTWKAIDAHEREYSSAPESGTASGAPLDIEDLARQLTEMKRELARVTRAETA